MPDHVDGPKLKQNVLTHLNHLQQQQAQWPATQDEAYRIVAHHLMMAVMDQQPQGQ